MLRQPVYNRMVLVVPALPSGGMLWRSRAFCSLLFLTENKALISKPFFEGFPPSKRGYPFLTFKK